MHTQGLVHTWVHNHAGDCTHSLWLTHKLVHNCAHALYHMCTHEHTNVSTSVCNACLHRKTHVPSFRGICKHSHSRTRKHTHMSTPARQLHSCKHTHVATCTHVPVHTTIHFCPTYPGQHEGQLCRCGREGWTFILGRPMGSVFSLSPNFGGAGTLEGLSSQATQLTSAMIYVKYICVIDTDALMAEACQPPLPLTPTASEAHPRGTRVLEEQLWVDSSTLGCSVFQRLPWQRGWRSWDTCSSGPKSHPEMP